MSWQTAETIDRRDFDRLNAGRQFASGPWKQYERDGKTTRLVGVHGTLRDGRNVKAVT